MAVVVDLEVSSLFSESQRVEQVVIHVDRVEQLRDRRVGVGGRWGHGGGVGVAEVRVGARGTSIVQVAISAAWVDLSNGIVAAGHCVLRGAGALPGKLRSFDIPWVSNQNARSLRRVVDSPRTAHS